MSLDDLLSQSPGDLTLECSDGCLQVHKTFLGVASGVFGNAFNNEASPCTSMKVRLCRHWAERLCCWTLSVIIWGPGRELPASPPTPHSEYALPCCGGSVELTAFMLM